MEDRFVELTAERDELLAAIKRAALRRDSRDPLIADSVARLAVVNCVLGVLLAELRQQD